MKGGIENKITGNSDVKLRIFNSFREANEEDLKDTLNQTPVERLIETVELTLRVYGVTREQLMARDKKLNLTITQQE